MDGLNLTIDEVVDVFRRFYAGDSKPIIRGCGSGYSHDGLLRTTMVDELGIKTISEYDKNEYSDAVLLQWNGLEYSLRCQGIEVFADTMNTLRKNRMMPFYLTAEVGEDRIRFEPHHARVVLNRITEFLYDLDRDESIIHDGSTTFDRMKKIAEKIRQ